MTLAWTPDDTTLAVSSRLRVEGKHVLRKPVLAETTPRQMRGLIRSMKKEPRSRVVSLSNERYRACLTMPEEGGEEWERFCGDVIVFHCARYVLEGSAIPVQAV